MLVQHQNFEDLVVWKESMDLCKSVYLNFKFCKDFGLKDQIQRSAVSIASNIAEGFELYSNKQLIRHLRIVKGSCGELRTQLYIAVEQGYIEKIPGEFLIEQCKRISSMLQKFINARIKWDQASSSNP